MEDKKIVKYLVILGAGNMLSLILTAGVILYLAGKSVPVDSNGKPIPKEITTKVPESIEVNDGSEIAKEAKSGVYILEITDNGFNPEAMNALIGKKIDIEVVNKSKNSYVFQMGSLNVDPVTLQPGETKVISVESPTDLVKETGYAYKAVSVGGTGPEFIGTLIFTKGGK